MRCEGGDRGRHMAEGDKRRGQVMRYKGHSLVEADRGKERDTWQVVNE
jgi:hypothetical protein